jgi:hypothetical protein
MKIARFSANCFWLRAIWRRNWSYRTAIVSSSIAGQMRAKVFRTCMCIFLASAQLGLATWIK